MIMKALVMSGACGGVRTMKRLLMIGGTLVVLILIGTTVLGAQHQMGGRMQMGGQQEQPSGQPSMMGRGMMGMPMMMCQMMPQMMGGHMDPLGMVGGDQIDPKTMARMLQLRGDMLKAMGEVLLKHGKAMEEVQ
jgi:hypothetical protein